MEHYVWIGLGIVLLIAAAIGFASLLERSRQRAEVGLAPDQIKRKRALEKMADNLKI